MAVHTGRWTRSVLIALFLFTEPFVQYHLINNLEELGGPLPNLSGKALIGSPLEQYTSAGQILTVGSHDDFSGVKKTTSQLVHDGGVVIGLQQRLSDSRYILPEVQVL